MEERGLWEQLLVAGDTRRNKWDAHNICLTHRGVLSLVADEIATHMDSSKPHFVCAIRGTGVPTAVFLFRRTGVPLLWFRDASIDDLVPRYVRVAGKKLVLVDSHMITGLNVVRHARLVERLGAKIVSVFVLLDLDTYRTQQQQKLLSELRIPIRPSWTWSALKNMSSYKLDPEVANVFEQDARLGISYWR